ncbi:MAG: hypothetical protein MRK02_04555 [Candidatus Scalindua sp.]|nr:hypothetical protein [Candidatus Scalindua sp.]
MSKKTKRFSAKCRVLLPWFIVSMTVLGSHFAADAFLETFELWSHGKIGSISFINVGYVIFFAGMVYLLYRQKDNFFHPRSRHLSNESPEEKEHLALFLSTIPPILESSHGIPNGLRLSHDIHKDLDTIKAMKDGSSPVRWAWEMPLRSVQHHCNKLKTLTLVCSKESILQVHLFLAICKRYQFPNLQNIYLLARRDKRPELVEMWPINNNVGLNGFDFESFDELSNGMWYLIRAFRRKGYSESETMIDFTGQKPTSVVAATMTFNREIKAQYVSTISLKVLSYDVFYTSQTEFGL